MNGTAVALIVGLMLAAAVFMAVTSIRRARRQAATAELAQRIPTVTAGELVARRATPSDVRSITETMDRTFLDANGWSRDVATATADHLARTSPDLLGYVAVCDAAGSTIGFGVLSGVDPPQSRCDLGFALHPSARSRGHGHVALTAVLDAVHRAGVSTVVLGTDETNSAMRSCITRAGGIEVRRGRARLPDGSRRKGIWFEHTVDP
jgi:RimJ/RimL family protein N-acetyltransferase